MSEAVPKIFDRVIGGEAPLTEGQAALWVSDPGSEDLSPADLFARLGITKPALWLRFGRSAFGVALDAMSPLSPPRLAVPDYQCADVIRKLRAATAALFPYGLAEDLSPLRTSLLEAARGADVIMTCSYFGSNRIDTILTDLRDDIEHMPGLPWIIEDRVMAFPDPGSVMAYGDRCDFCVLSLRKVYPIPDGAVLIACSDRAVEALQQWRSTHQTRDPSKGDNVVRAKLRAKAQRSSWLHSGKLIDEPNISGLRASAESEGLVNEIATEAGEDGAAGSQGSLRYLATRDFKADLVTIRKHRQTILDAVGDAGCRDISGADGAGGGGVAVPMRSAARDALRQRIAKEGIFLPVHWPVHDLIALSSVAVDWHAMEISLPTLPTWSEDDVAYLCDRLCVVSAELAA